MNPGDKVTAPYRNNTHTGRVYTGIVLADDSIEAWTGTAAFDFGVPPSQEAVTARVKRNKELCLDLDNERIPVAWEFDKVYWENIASLELSEV